MARTVDCIICGGMGWVYAPQTHTRKDCPCCGGSGEDFYLPESEETDDGTFDASNSGGSDG